jgi:hypothetical protein
MGFSIKIFLDSCPHFSRRKQPPGRAGALVRPHVAPSGKENRPTFARRVPVQRQRRLLEVPISLVWRKASPRETDFKALAALIRRLVPPQITGLTDATNG